MAGRLGMELDRVADAPLQVEGANVEVVGVSVEDGSNGERETHPLLASFKLHSLNSPRSVLPACVVFLSLLGIVSLLCLFIPFPSSPSSSPSPASPTSPSSPFNTSTPSLDGASPSEAAAADDVAAGSKAAEATHALPALYSYKILKTFPHDTTSFTEGLFYEGKDSKGRDMLYESTGMYYHSTVRRVVLETGVAETVQRNSNDVFGEGIALLHNRTRLYQLAWQRTTGSIFNAATLEPIGTFRHGMTDGWALTTSADGKLYGSDGTHFLYQLDEDDLSKVVKKVEVKDGSRTIGYINELESVDALVFANIWQTPCVAMINPSTGDVSGWVVLKGLWDKAVARYNGIDVLNGIAWDSAGKRLFVTGKYFPYLFQIQLVPDKSNSLGAVRSMCWPRVS